MNPRVLSALQQINELTDRGLFFHAVLYPVAGRYGLDDREVSALIDLYDAQG